LRGELTCNEEKRITFNIISDGEEWVFYNQFQKLVEIDETHRQLVYNQNASQFTSKINKYNYELSSKISPKNN
jgi:hypothetical protein